MEEEISLSELFITLKKRLSLIISLGMIALILAAGFTFFIATPQYNATTQILVNRTTESAEGLQLTDINTNVQMINTYKDIIKGPVILNEVQENLETNLTTTELSEKIEITTQENSQVFSLTVTDDSPYDAAEIANAVAVTFQSEIGNIMNVENVTIISEAVPVTDQISPNNSLNLVIGLLVGLMLGVGIAFLLEFMDKTVRDERFITETLGWSVLGSVSEMSNDELKAEVRVKKAELNTRRTKSRV
ncbi:Capsular polysaccharide biosynthesis protein [Carnobacterium alterfunditum]|uniref:Capsular polysaccharide biosynthesis protein CpsC n=1 Tax=Carnobacterium alterfunditum TaxID=28230 RepID=A0A1N6HIF0_9LACT|nr:Wzz/FepE/Etk N-terminal domain-containing protein [Carnobacterium alterfunditum]SIO19532.1 Capsular polysaccharide biosynthesis protein [Carnobacterium alterfunditum]